MKKSLSLLAVSLLHSAQSCSPPSSPAMELSTKLKATPVANDVLDFTLVNDTGYDIDVVRVSPSDEERLGDDILGEEDILEDGDEVDIEFDPEDEAEEWDMLIEWNDEDEEDDIIYDLDLSEINTLTLTYDEDADEVNYDVE